ncbi:hypothetical protein V1508DRAFT_414996 [Lipomyces doorenjongii]|uniref:uncharacterized protein n=1 Tax=Lipomyces doorenjongii TaxID=383834 RepID=UPI0034CE03A0
MPSTAVQFAPLRSFVDPSFFSVLTAKKLNEYRLDASEKPLIGLYSIPVSTSASSSGIVTLDGGSFDETASRISDHDCIANGTLLNLNTIEEFKQFDKSHLIHEEGKKIFDAIQEGEIIKTPSKLCSFYLITFSDLKKYKFYYWFAFPAVHSDWAAAEVDSVVPVGLEASEVLTIAITSWRKSVDKKLHGFFLLKQTSGEWKVGSLSEWAHFWDDADTSAITVGFIDTSAFPNHPGWPLRNFLVFLKHQGLLRVKVLCFRDLRTLSSESRSIWMQFERSDVTGTDEQLRTTGWERNSQNKLAPKMSDLAPLMDPKRLADQAVDLNLKLMRWRIAPNLDIDKVQRTKCLLLGAGTLGSYVARALMGWGVRQITFVDNATVSFSNPVRQPLYNFTDCLEGGAVKATRAAEALKEIYPGVDSVGYCLSVPMAGHPVSNEKSQRYEYEKLVELIDAHDAIFLLMDSREARWLPTVIACAKRKVVINAALGFDSYVVMRHGVRDTTGHERLGCYFCNDIFAPSDSLTDRTLDQMCTVTRPGVALIASGLAAELFVSIIQHPLGPEAPAPSAASKNSDGNGKFQHPLGDVPHQMRGFLHNFQQMNIKGANYTYCSACSNPILQAWEKDGWSFVRNALNVPKFVDEVSGLAEVQRRACEIAEEEDWDYDDDGSVDM